MGAVPSSSSSANGRRPGPGPPPPSSSAPRNGRRAAAEEEAGSEGEAEAERRQGGESRRLLSRSPAASAASMEGFLGGCRAALQVAKGVPCCPRIHRCPLPLEMAFHPQSHHPMAAWGSLGEHVRSNREVHVVMGNESCDLDSAVSALALSYFFAKTLLDSKAAFIPVLNIPRLDFPLRTESTFLLKQQHIPESALIFRDEIDLFALHRAGLLSLTLVDHHVLPRDADLEEAVVEVIDHRPLERERGPSCKVTSELVGSCATLVTERILQGSCAEAQVLDRQTAALLHATIVLDCVNMAPEAGKVTPRDTHYASLLESQFPDLPPRSSIFEALQTAKFDVSGLTTDEMLRKDLKTLSGKEVTIALSAVYMNLKAFLGRPGLEQELRAFCQQRCYDALLAMTISFNESKEPFRQLAVYSQQAELRTAVCQALERSSHPSLDLSPLTSPFPTVLAYDQGNATASRKKVLPIVRGFLRQWGQQDPARPAMQPEGRGSRCHEAGSEPKGSSGRGAESHGVECGSTGGKDPTKCHRMGEDLADEDALLPPTPMNSLVDECPLDQGLPKLSAEAVFEKFNRIAMARSSPDGSPQKK
ncbi:exopolyphosphatase PRUNE1 isoform X2 [Hemicordylus capensis]|uniref:exopolyphosphatase PRUNE1 isoform X2 n=1 Tax=Hemicordylus capensis TaxID=884348 RepID=UPI0023025D83|nr:exopolyphosphatase PRUNE1 isoform X2 [Hemicordylus capensis]